MGEHILIASLSLLFLPVLVLVIFVITLATLGKSVGVRETYVGILLKIFEVREILKIMCDCAEFMY